MSTRVLKSMNEPVLQEFYKLARLREHRENRNQVIVCGTKMVKDLAAQGSVFQDILYPAAGDVPFDLKSSGGKYAVGVDSLRRVSQLHDFNGLIGKLAMPEEKLEDLPFPRLVACLDVRDIGNLGTLLRSALAFQWHGVWILRGSGDIFDPKTLRAALGAQFHLPFRIGSLKSLMSYCKKNNLTLTRPRYRRSQSASATCTPRTHGNSDDKAHAFHTSSSSSTSGCPTSARSSDAASPPHSRYDVPLVAAKTSDDGRWRTEGEPPCGSSKENGEGLWQAASSSEERARLLEAEIRSFHSRNKDGREAVRAEPWRGTNDRKLTLGGEKGTGACVILSDQKGEVRWPRSTVELEVSNPALDFPVFAATCLYEVKRRWFLDAPRSASVPTTKKK